MKCEELTSRRDKTATRGLKFKSQTLVPNTKLVVARERILADFT
jgi:hypothetical protein